MTYKQYAKYAHLYGSHRWRMRALRQKKEHPICAMCLKDGLIKQASVADHIEPHNGDKVKFFNGPLQSLCSHHHNSDKKMIEQRGFTNHIGVDGWPVDPNHPANARK